MEFLINIHGCQQLYPRNSHLCTKSAQKSQLLLRTVYVLGLDIRIHIPFNNDVTTMSTPRTSIQEYARTYLQTRYRTKNLKRFIQGLVFKGILKGQESKSWDFFEGPRRFRGPQKSEKFYFSKRTKTSVDHKFKSFAIN